MTNIPVKPTNTTITDSQWQAIYDSGENILVSASAGSGKTFVLVERVIQKVLSGIDVNKLLIVTFTEAAAAEMKERLEAKIIETINETKDAATQKHLQRQLTLLPQANISTMHAFCMTVIRRFYYLIDIDPVFRMLSDETEITLMKEKIWSDLREELYEIDGKPNKEFYDLTANFSGDRNDNGLQTLVFSLYEFARSNPNPLFYLDNLVNNYKVTEGNVAGTSIYQDIIKKELENKGNYLLKSAYKMKDLADLAAFDKMDAIANEQIMQVSGFLEMLEKDDLQAMQDYLATIEVFRAIAHNAKQVKEIPEIRKEFNDRNSEIRDFFREIEGKLFAIPQETLVDILAKSADLITLLVEVTKEFMSRFANEKRAKNTMDFSDLEHFTVDILTQKQADGTFQPTSASDYYREFFEEVMIDEYQDTNMIQETIARFVAKDNNRFMVGDVKQSIYMFRQADPSLFIEKYNNYGKQLGGKRIVLAENFRSRAEVLDFTNLVFTQLMNSELGQIEYDTAAKLVNGNKSFPESSLMNTELLIYEKEEETEEIIDDILEIQDKAQGEITMVAMKIHELIENKTQIFDKKLGQNRQLEYKDIVLLAPTRRQNVQIQEIFEEFGIPVAMNDADSYFKRTEVLTMLSLLQLIDNPYQDIPLAAVLRSAIVGLSENELAKIRLNDRSGSFYEATLKTHDIEKLEVFKEQLEEWRTISRQISLNNLIWQIYQDTAYIDYVAGLAYGAQRQANLYSLATYANEFEEMSFRGLFQFIKFIEKRQERGQDLAEPVMIGMDNSVRVMTIHGSKGLEFPYVFLMNSSKQWNEEDTRGKFVFDDKLGIGIQYLDQNKRLKYSTFIFEAIKQERRKKMLSEEMRKLYVALTRAEQKLILVGSEKDKEKLLEKWAQAASEHSEVINKPLREKTRNMLDWVGLTLARHRSMSDFMEEQAVIGGIKNHPADFSIHFYKQSDLKKPNINQAAILVKSDENLSNITEEFAKARARLNFDYKEKAAINTTTYQSVSEIKQIFIDPDQPEFLSVEVTKDGKMAANKHFNEELAKPNFLGKKSKTITAAQVGTATHQLLQQYDFGGDEDLEQLLEKLTTQGIIEKEIAQKVEINKVANFLNSDFGLYLKANHASLKREQPFSMLINPQDIFENYPENQTDDLLIHGIIDGYIETADGLVLFDYKTDHSANSQMIKERYQGQINLYAKALELATGKKVARAVIVLLSQNSLVEMLDT